MIGAFAECSYESCKNVKMKGWLQDFPMNPPLVDLPRDQTLTQKVVEQFIKEYLLRVFRAAQHDLDVLRLQEHDVWQER